MSDEEQAMTKAWQAYAEAKYHSDGVDDACRAYHHAMIAATPGLCVHEADGTVRRPTSRDL